MVYPLTNVSSWWSNDVTGQLLATMTTTLILWFIISKIQTRGNQRSLPGPRGLPVVGYLPFLGSDLRWTFKDLATTYGPIFKVQLGTKECVVVSSPSLAKEILKDQDVIFANRIHTTASEIASFGRSDIAFCDYGPEWRKMKKIVVSEMLSNANIDASYSFRKKHVKKMISKTYNNKVGELVDVGELAFITIFSSIMSMVWGDMVKGEDGEDTEAEFRSVVADIVILLGVPNMSDYLPFLARFDLQGVQRKMKLACDKMQKLFGVAIDHHNAVGVDTRKDFLGCLLQLTKLEDPAAALSLLQVQGIISNAIIGGMDTTATTVDWAMAELLKHPQIMRTVQEELTETIGLNNTAEETHLPKLKYLNAVVKETLRLHPPVPLLVPHRPSMATTVGGYTVPKDSMIFINTWFISRDPDLWKDPLEFQPERFLNSSKTFDLMGNNHQYLPFGSGRRMCPGVSLAEKMSMFVLSSLLHSFEWTLPDGTKDVDLSEIFGMAVKKSKPTMAIPTPRLSRPELYTNE